MLFIIIYTLMLASFMNKKLLCYYVFLLLSIFIYFNLINIIEFYKLFDID